MAAGMLIAGRADAPSVVLIHGLAGSHHVWDRVLPLIERNTRTYALNLAGSNSIERDADQAAELIPARAVLVGHSRGGLVATAVAERHPRLAKTLILICPPWIRESRLSAKRPIERAFSAPGIGDLIWVTATPRTHRKALGSAFASGTPVPDWSVEDLRATGRRRLAAASRAIDTYLGVAPLAQRLAALPVPAELLFGEHDARVACPPSAMLAHTLLTRVGHTPPWEAPDRIADVIASAARRDHEVLREQVGLVSASAQESQR
ncbi:MAG TPA: alpha/beta hydrolase [Solirubrobacteraceae bacterium]|jgi:pimeloyl-ACP methyl ester carboxylesterase|nr:alpha/beta hydrolase [Solirubrobacteraceae bacterium]